MGGGRSFRHGTGALEEPIVEGDIDRSVADIAMATSTLGYDPAVDLQDGLERTVGWLRKRF